MRRDRPVRIFITTVAVALAGGCASPQKSVPPMRSTAAATPSRPAPAPGPAMSTARTGALTLESAVRRAVSWHPSILEASGRANQQAEAIAEARAGYYPEIGGGLNSGHDNRRARSWRPVLGLNGSQMIYDFGKVTRSVELARAGLSTRNAQTLAAIDVVARDTAHAVIELQRNAALAGIARDQVRDTQDVLDLVRMRTSEGASTRSDRLQAEARVQAARSTLLEVEAQTRRWQATLAILIGERGTPRPSGDVPAWLDRACTAGEPDWTSAPAILQAEAQREAANIQLALSRAEALPTLSLEGGVGTDLTDFSEHGREYRIGLAVTGSLYNGGATSARRNAAGHALGAAEAALAKARVEVTRNLSEARVQVSSLRELHASLGERIAMMRETRDLYQTQYIDLGTRTLLDLLNADQELHGARFDHANIAHELRRLAIDCTFNAGRTRRAFALEGAATRTAAAPSPASGHR